MDRSYVEGLQAHYARVFGAAGTPRKWSRGPVANLPPDFCVLEHPPTEKTFSWVYATCAMSPASDSPRLEAHLLAPTADDAHVELLTILAHFHVTGSRLGLHHTVNFGRPWLPESRCDRGFLSLPYPFGPSLEHAALSPFSARCLWLIPMTPEEVEHKKRFGVESLERRFEERQFKYLDPARPSVA